MSYDKDLIPWMETGAKRLEMEPWICWINLRDSQDCRQLLLHDNYLRQAS